MLDKEPDYNHHHTRTKTQQTNLLVLSPISRNISTCTAIVTTIITTASTSSSRISIIVASTALLLFRDSSLTKGFLVQLLGSLSLLMPGRTSTTTRLTTFLHLFEFVQRIARNVVKKSDILVVELLFALRCGFYGCREASCRDTTIRCGGSTLKFFSRGCKIKTRTRFRIRTLRWKHF